MVEPEELPQYLNVIENKIAVLSELSNELSMSYEIPETIAAAPQKVNCYSWAVDFLNDMAAECMLKGITPKLKNTLSYHEKACLYIDIYQLDRALLSITGNAFRYCQAYFSILIEIKNHQFIISIKNDGVALDTDSINKIFERFYTEEKINNEGHLGLGLYIAKTIINSFNGKINAKKRK